MNATSLKYKASSAAFAVAPEEDIEKAVEFEAHVLDGLSLSPKTLHPKYFYDQKGSAIFDEICRLEEYYPYRAELSVLPTVADALAQRLERPAALIEFGAGSLEKVVPVLQRNAHIQHFVPIDISGEHLHGASRELANQFPRLVVSPVVADFTQSVRLNVPKKFERIGFFPGSTIGNFHPDEARQFLNNARSTLGSDSLLIVGVDTRKAPATLHRAYNDAKGVTAEFNLNILHRINAHFGKVFDMASFEHYAFYNPVLGRIEMHLICQKACELHIAGRSFSFEAGETIHTENSYKYAPSGFSALAASAGWRTEQYWLAQEEAFSVFLLRSADTSPLKKM